MRITPLDVRKQEFRKIMRGLDPEEVQAFLVTVADEYEAVLLDNKQLRERILELDEKIQEYRHMEKTLRDTLMTAERVLAEARENARKEADLILKDAEIRAQQNTENFRRLAADLRREIVDLHKEKESYLARFKGLAEAQIQFIANHQTDFEDLDRRLMDLAQPRGDARRSGSGPAAPPGEGPPAVAASEASPTQAAAGQPAMSAGQATMRDQWRDYEPGSAVGGRGRTAGAGATAGPTRTEAWDEPAAVPGTPVAKQPPVERPDLAPEEVDELLEPLADVHEQLARLSPSARDDGPVSRAAADKEKPEQHERDGAWNMEAFTRGLSDL